MLRMILALILSAAIVLLTGPKLIAWLRKLKLGQTIYELGPQSHQKKQGTPIMGGLCIALGCVVAFVVSMLAIRFLMGFVKKHDFKVFGWYRIVLGALVIGWFLLK